MAEAATAYLQAPSVMAALYSVRCHSRKDSGRPKPEMSVQNSQLPRLLCPTPNLDAIIGTSIEGGTIIQCLADVPV